MNRFMLAALLLSIALPSAAQVNKCKGPGGKIIYSDAACDTPERMQRLRIQDNSLDASGDRRLVEEGAVNNGSEMDALNERSQRLQQQSDAILSKGSRMSIGDTIRLKQLRAEQKSVQRSIMIQNGQDTTAFDNEERLNRMDRKVRRMELEQDRVRNEHNNPIVNGRQCTRNGNYLNC